MSLRKRSASLVVRHLEQTKNGSQDAEHGPFLFVQRGEDGVWTWQHYLAPELRELSRTTDPLGGVSLNVVKFLDPVADALDGIPRLVENIPSELRGSRDVGPLPSSAESDVERLRQIVVLDVLPQVTGILRALESGSAGQRWWRP